MKYGVPLKMVNHAGIPDSLEIWISLVCVPGFGLAVPLAVVSADVYTWLAFLIVAPSCFIALAVAKARIGVNLSTDRGLNRRIDLKWLLAAQGVAGFTYLQFINTAGDGASSVPQVVLLVVAYILCGTYALLILFALIGEMYRKVWGNQDIMTVEIADQLYLVALKHVHNYWVLIPCEMTRGYAKGNIHFKSGEREMTDIIKFTKGRFIIRDVSLLENTKNILCRESHELLGVK
jgi:hypothetical protein